jgi:Domain of unknown function (DUF5615)
MRPLLFDQGLFPSVARALRELSLEALAVGEPGAPAEGSSDADNCKWCSDTGAILVTNDRGKKEKDILDALAEYHVHALFIYKDLRAGPPHRLAGALLAAEQRMDDVVSRPRGGLLRHKLKPGGRIEKR